MIINVDENIRLELTSPKHAVACFEAVNKNRSHLSEFLPWVDSMQSVEDFIQYITHCELLYQERKEISFMIMYDNDLVGRISLSHINLLDKHAAIGYWLDENTEGKGIITKSCKCLISYTFQELGLNRIEIKAATGNLKSQAIPERLNFTKEGILREAGFVNGKFLDLILYSMLKYEWDPLQGQTYRNAQ